MTTQSITSTSGQKRQIASFATVATEKVLDALDLSKEESQRVIENGDEFTEIVRAAVEQAIQKLRSPADYASEEEDSTYGYLSGYTKPNGLTEQANKLRVLFPGLGFTNLDYQEKIEKLEIKLPKHAEGWFCVPNWIKNPTLFGENYSSAVQKILDVLKQAVSGNFYNYREGEIDEAHLRQSAHSKAFWEKLSESQGNPDILIVPIQFGLFHRGRSIRLACVLMVDAKNEFGLDAFATGCLLLTHPNRLANVDDLWIDCAGDEFAPEADGQFVSAPYFYFSGGRLKFGTGDLADAFPGCGSVSGFLPALGVES